MTEIERIIEKGIIKPEFLYDEIIDGCEVKSDLKKVWAVLIDLLYEFDKVCKKHNLKYWLAAGSLIGAVRHKGFIPWDDDLDVFMMRDDCDKLIQIAENEFNHPYFFQTPYSDKGYYFSFPKLRNSNTTAMSNDFVYEKFNQGIYLDIFPLDNCLEEGAQDRYDEIKELIMENATYMRVHNPNPDIAEIERRKKYLLQNHNQIEVYEKMEYICRQFNGIETDKVILAANTMAPVEKHIYDRNWFEDTTYISFYGIEAPLPIGYDCILRNRYGDYTIIPPAEEREWHSNEIIDVNKSYIYYQK